MLGDVREGLGGGPRVLDVYCVGDICVVAACGRVFDVHVRRFGGVTGWVVEVERGLDITTGNRGGGRGTESPWRQRLCHGGCHFEDNLITGTVFLLFRR